MSFSSIDFFIFFFIILAVTCILQRHFSQRASHCFLLLSSYFFYGYWNWHFCFLLLFVTCAAYCSARASGRSNISYLIGVIIPLSVLGYFKYTNFFLSSFSPLFNGRSQTFSIILPVGISFYTFQALSYVIDVHRKKIPVETDFIRLALYLSFFPQLVAGPIVKASEFLPQLHENRKITIDRLRCGIQIFLIGLFKKVVLADHISVFVDDVFHSPAAFHWSSLLLAVFSYSLQIYLDFSGYSDMAIGCGKCLGYDFNRNFDLPYFSQSVTEFWHRWHISLSTWLKEYLYIPLGGNRKGSFRTYVNLFITMVLGGLWHGASWTFVFWGALNGAALCIDKFFFKRPQKDPSIKVLNVFSTFLFISFTWIFFRADRFTTAWAVIKGIFTLQRGVQHPFIWSFLGLGLLLFCTIAAVLRARKAGREQVNGYYPILSLDSVRDWTILFVFIGLIAAFAYTGEQPFIYFQF